MRVQCQKVKSYSKMHKKCGLNVVILHIVHLLEIDIIDLSKQTTTFERGFYYEKIRLYYDYWKRI
jgi:uncharacterized protein YqhQ